MNKQDQVINVSKDGSTQAAYVYNSHGQYDGVKLGNGITEKFGYNADGQIEALVISNSSGALLNEKYQRDANGNITSITTNGQTGASLVTYQYDAMNRLTQVTNAHGDVTKYTYDPMGNILTKTVTPAGGSASTTTYTYNAGNELTAVNGQAYTYDANGNLTNSGVDTYKWNELGQLREVDNSSGTPIALYTYDAFGRRVSEQANGKTTDFYYEGMSTHVSYETDGSGNLMHSYTYGTSGEPLTMTTWSGGTGTTYYYHENQHGDVVALTDSNGNTVAQYSYDVWGKVVSQSGTMACKSKNENSKSC